MGVKPQAAWYSAYTGVGAIDPAKKETTIEDSSRNVVAFDNRPVRPAEAGVGLIDAAVIISFYFVHRTDRSVWRGLI